MRIGIMGAGSIGCFLGGSLLLKSNEVIMVGRAKLGGELEKWGMKLTDGDGRKDSVAPQVIEFSEKPEALAPCRTVFVTVKSPGSAEAARGLDAVLPGNATVVSFQNGVRNADIIRENLPGRTVLAGIFSFNVKRFPPVTFHRGTSGPLVIEKPAAEGARVKLDMVANALRAAGFTVLIREDIVPLQWGKLILNLNNAVNALAGIPLREQLTQRPYRLVLARVMSEALSVLKQAGIQPKSLDRINPSMGPRILPLPNWLFFRVAARMIQIDEKARSSMQDDLEAGRDTEIDFLNGEIVRLAGEHGVEAPVNTRIVELIRQAEQARAGTPRIEGPELLRIIREK